MTRVLLAAPQPDVRAALRLLLLDLSMEVVGEAADWPIALVLAPETQPDMLHCPHKPNGCPPAGSSLRRGRRLYQ
jgi:DNA-binding NarL/FixJ family response regulator